MALIKGGKRGQRQGRGHRENHVHLVHRSIFRLKKRGYQGQERDTPPYPKRGSKIRATESDPP